ncbi:unnamed protein product [Ilex paraguariensis]|uniref:Uncharacterized protein n=1 Tax=Ilex paraguariensis TaxID=185542 RepID=A0ABC8RUC5_9AQUA
MATSLMPFRPVGVRACTTSGHRKSDTHHRKSSSSNWLTPLFGWSSEPDYIDSGNNSNNKIELSMKVERKSDSDLDQKPSRSRFGPGRFTDEKARQLRMMTMDTSAFHDIMYHSAIASRLASDFSNRSDQ